MPKNTQDLEDRIEIALQAYAKMEKPKIAKLAREFDVPYQLLRGRVQGRKSPKCRTGPSKALEPEQEQALIHWIHTLNAANSPPTAEMIRDCAVQILRGMV
ncbi:transcriptional regulator family: Centromere protein B, DNA-binding region [Penicillium roqueforti]|jgi:hypothetical protein|uniref:uncharacterized protein n=1 Tax=Penicillium rubens TaxID=1108849 RepID=UPI002A5A15D2|nr:uncharacterized protein N7525_004634 [Penicillium rubens]KAI2716302.1 transcriptional regulator family: Centromere protein B, DNA-binding region [Penicillium roqueforti]KAI2740571.1 transcriptional regulator family: Centromere protein B, DNA-binding region [Penicillium roqueforti]KAI3162540.1 transcriptional regulator family: Centromere protein B, DNA-binding region [Penicillium roqueforti]KAJ5839446.1 hypothetical protein N7525_004634 [Penicillium rubens]